MQSKGVPLSNEDNETQKLNDVWNEICRWLLDRIFNKLEN